MTSELSAVVDLLQEAVGDRFRIDVLGRDDPHGPSVELTTTNGRRLRFNLQPWQEDNSAVGEYPDTLWVLQRTSKLQRDRLRRNHTNFVDLRGGAVRLELPDLLVDRTDLKPKPRVRQTGNLIDPFADRSSLVLRVLLNHAAGRAWGVRELAQEAGVDPATASRATRQMARQRLLQAERVGRSSRVTVTEPRRLLRRWTELYDWTMNKSVPVHAPVGSVQSFIDRAPDLLRRFRWALTLQAGASMVAPHASWERLHVYLDVRDVNQLYEFLREKHWASAEDGKLVFLLPYYRQSIWHGLSQVKKINVVSDLQLVLDLWNYPVRGREQAEHIIEMRLASVWEDGWSS